ncbi:hypothetical protein TI04_05520, partial [Achromatium sp. WMS2]
MQGYGYRISTATNTVSGSPLAPPAALASGLTVERHVFDVDGNNIDDQDLEQGTTVIVVLKGEVNTQNI